MDKIVNYPESVYEQIFGGKATPWKKIQSDRGGAISAAEKMFAAFMEEESKREDKDSVEKFYCEPAVLQRFYDLYFKEQKSEEEIAKELNKTQEETHRIVAFVLRKMRSPSRSRALKKFLDND